jgi:hypothetical protein
MEAWQAVKAQADLHHQYLLGLELMVAVREGPKVIEAWMFRLFRRQHHEKFLSSFEKLGLGGLPHAVACARYHVLSNSIGGVAVEYMEESARKAWVRFRYPRWMYAGAAICGVPVEASRGFLRGWYAHNGVSLNNPRLGFVCVSEDMTGSFGFCGYFREYDHDLSAQERLQFRPGERPPPFDPAAQPKPPTADWGAERLAKAERNYAVEYIRNGLVELAGVVGTGRAMELGKHAARLIGLQTYPAMAAAVGAVDGDARDAARFLAGTLAGMDDEATVEADGVTVRQRGLRIVRGLDADARRIVLDCWVELWRGAVHSHRAFLDLDVQEVGDGLVWTVTPR